MGVYNRPDLTPKRAKGIRGWISDLHRRMFPGAAIERDRAAAAEAERRAREQAEREQAARPPVFHPVPEGWTAVPDTGQWTSEGDRFTYHPDAGKQRAQGRLYGPSVPGFAPGDRVTASAGISGGRGRVSLVNGKGGTAGEIEGDGVDDDGVSVLANQPVRTGHLQLILVATEGRVQFDSPTIERA